MKIGMKEFFHLSEQLYFFIKTFRKDARAHSNSSADVGMDEDAGVVFAAGAAPGRYESLILRQMKRGA